MIWGISVVGKVRDRIVAMHQRRTCWHTTITCTVSTGWHLSQSHPFMHVSDTIPHKHERHKGRTESENRTNCRMSCGLVAVDCV